MLFLRILCQISRLRGQKTHLQIFQYKINVKEKGKVYDNTAKMQSTNQLGV